MARGYCLDRCRQRPKEGENHIHDEYCVDHLAKHKPRIEASWQQGDFERRVEAGDAQRNYHNDVPHLCPLRTWVDQTTEPRQHSILHLAYIGLELLPRWEILIRASIHLPADVEEALLPHAGTVSQHAGDCCHPLAHSVAWKVVCRACLSLPTSRDAVTYIYHLARRNLPNSCT